MSDVRFQIHLSAARFLNAAGSLMEASMGTCSYIYSGAHELVDNPNLAFKAKFLTFHRDDDLCGCGLWTPNQPLVLSDFSATALESLNESSFPPQTLRNSVFAPTNVVTHLRSLDVNRWSNSVEQTLWRSDLNADNNIQIPGTGVWAHQNDFDQLVSWATAFEFETTGQKLSASAVQMLEHLVHHQKVWLWKDAQLRSMLIFTNDGPQSLRLSSIFTPKSFRGHGFAAAMIRSLRAQLLRDSRREVHLFSDKNSESLSKLYTSLQFERAAEFSLLPLKANRSL